MSLTPNLSVLPLSKRLIDLSNQDLSQLALKFPNLQADEVTFPVRGRELPSLYPGSWRRIPVRLAKTAKFTFDQLQFQVTDGGGRVSSVPDPIFNQDNPTIVLLAGARVGTYKLLALAPVPNKPPRVVGRLEFVVDVRETAGVSDGPPIWIDGQVAGLGTASGQPTWGEPGAAGKTAQVYPEVAPAIGTKRVLVLLVDTASDRYPAADIPTIIADLRGALTDGALDPQDNVVRSVRLFYEEMSYFVKGATPAVGLTIDGQVHGPISLPGNWKQYFPQSYLEELGPDPTDPEPDPTKKKQIVVRRFYGAAYHYAAIVDAVIARNKTLPVADQVDLTSFDILCCIVRSVRPVQQTDAFETFWPHQHYITLKIPVPTEADPGATVNKNLNPLTMPDDWTTIRSRTFQDTWSHEFGHSLGLGDLYTPPTFDVGANHPVQGPFRNLGSWDSMAFEELNPHFSLVTRLKLGWVKPDWLKRFNFLLKNDVDETFTLGAVEKGSPAAGSFIGAEIRIASNWNYYVEYRARQLNQIGDTQLLNNDRVVCTDAISQGFQQASGRPEIVLLWNDPSIQSAGPVLGIGQSYLEQDPDGNGKQLKITVLSIKNGLATVRVQYKVFGIDLGIRPWPAGPDRPWQSPDIEIRNERAKSDPTYTNTAWTGQVNEVVAKITNSGTVDAPKVAVQISVKDYNLGGDTPITQPLSKVIKDVPAGATVEFVTQWIPTKDGHSCIYVEILPYATAGPPLLVDMNPGNSIAQSNYSSNSLPASSPTERTIATVKVGNPYDRPATAYLVASQNNQFYRTYLSNRWVLLKPKEVREITVMMESRLDWDEDQQEFMPFMSAAEARTLAKLTKQDWAKLIRRPNAVSVTAYMPDPTMRHMHSIRLLGGAQMQVRSGRRVQILQFTAQGNQASGFVATLNTEKPIPAGTVIVIYKNENASRTAYLTLPVKNGLFRTQPNSQGGGFQHNFAQAQAYFVPTGEYGEAYSAVVSLSEKP